jgi:hypothetical protein
LGDGVTALQRHVERGHRPLAQDGRLGGRDPLQGSGVAREFGDEDLLGRCTRLPLSAQLPKMPVKDFRADYLWE